MVYYLVKNTVNGWETEFTIKSSNVISVFRHQFLTCFFFPYVQDFFTVSK